MTTKTTRVIKPLVPLSPSGTYQALALAPHMVPHPELRISKYFYSCFHQLILFSLTSTTLRTLAMRSSSPCFPCFPSFILNPYIDSSFFSMLSRLQSRKGKKQISCGFHINLGHPERRVNGYAYTG